MPEPLPPLEDYTFEGYRNADGSVGTKNLLGITTSVHCMADVVNYVVKIIERNLLPKYPSIDGVVDLNHLYGCGVAINAPTAVVPIRTIHNIALNPNFGGEVMVVVPVAKSYSHSACRKERKMCRASRSTEPASYAYRTNSTLALNQWSTISCRLPHTIWKNSTRPARHLPGLRAGGGHALRWQRRVLRRYR